MQLTLCERHPDAAMTDLIRVAREIRQTLEDGEMQATGAIYVSCNGRGGPHFGTPNAESHALREALGNVPLVGFFAGGEIARERLYGYTGVLTVFTHPR
jgi:small ligand-binding sensory domain FIST